MSMKNIHRSVKKIQKSISFFTPVYTILVFFIFLVISASLNARKPAVEPVLEIIIEEETLENNVTPPNNWPNFIKGQPISVKKNTKRKPIKVVTTKSLRKEDSFPIYLAVLIGLLPFAILGGIILPLSKHDSNVSNNVTNIRNTSKKKDDDSSWPKAS